MGCHVSKESKEIISEDAKKDPAANFNKDSDKLAENEETKKLIEVKPNEVKTNNETHRTVPDKNDDKNTPQTNHAAPEVDIDLKDPEVMKAATKIQATFRGHMARKENPKDEKKSPEPPQNGSEEILADILDLDPNDKNIVDAITKIQAGFRGLKVRKDLKKMPSTDEGIKNSIQNEKMAEEEEEEEPIDLNDPDLEKAATKIQATFRGHRARTTKDPA